MSRTQTSGTTMPWMSAYCATEYPKRLYTIINYHNQNYDRLQAKGNSTKRKSGPLVLYLHKIFF